MRRRVRLLRLFGLGGGFLECKSYAYGVEVMAASAAMTLQLIRRVHLTC
jgi:hypothetical protein